MAYNNGFPMNYAQMYPAQMQPQVQAQQPRYGGLNWVQGEAGAKSFLVAPNTTIDLWDSEAQTIYLKSADASGMPSMKILDYTIREQSQNMPSKTPLIDDGAEYVTKDEMDSFRAEISKKIDDLAKEALGA